MRNRGVVEQQLALRVSSSRQPQLAVQVSEENVSALGSGQLQGHIQKREQDFIQNAGGVQLARGLQKDSQLFQISDFVGNLDTRNLAEEITRGVGGDALGMEDRIN